MCWKIIESISKMIKADSAASTVVAVALLLGILAIFFMNIQVNFVPQWEEDSEYAHMLEVCEDMSRLKSNIDILSTGLNIDPDARNTLNTPFRMEGGELPFFQRTRPVSTLTLAPEGSMMSVSVTENNSTTRLYPKNGPLATGTISHHTSNFNYINQVYTYENGALIISQNDRSFMRLPPLISLERETNVTTLSVDAICLKGSAETLSSNGVEDLRLKSRSRSDLYDMTDLENIRNETSASLTIFTEYPEAWKMYFNTTACDEHLHWGTDYKVSSNSSAVVLTLHPVDDDLEIKIYKSEIDVDMVKW